MFLESEEPSDLAFAERGFPRNLEVEYRNICLCGQCSKRRAPRIAGSQLHRFGAWRGRSEDAVSVSAFYQRKTRTLSLFLENLCLATHDRHKETGAVQALVIVEGRRDGTGWTGAKSLEALLSWSFEAPGASPCFISLVEVCSLEKLAHPDLLYALVTGFDQIWIQRAKQPKAQRQQDREQNLVAAMGGAGRCFSFQDLADVRKGIVKPVENSFQLLTDLAPDSSKWEIVHACAKVLLPEQTSPVPLPDQAPYGQVTLSREGCDQCQACIWVCPTDAITLAPGGCSLNFTEKACDQCGLCVSICPQRCLHLTPCMDLTDQAKAPQPLETLIWPGDAAPDGKATEDGADLGATPMQQQSQSDSN